MKFILFCVHSTGLAVAIASGAALPIALIFPSLGRSVFAQTLPETQADSVPVPDFLNPDPNPLQLPIQPQEVKIQRTQPITLAEALELAKRNNRELQVAILELERSRSALRESQAVFSPNVNVNANLTNNGDGFTGSGSQSRTSVNGQAQINYDIYTSGNRQARVREAEERLQIDELDVENRTLEVRLNVTTQYYDLQEADEQVRINQSAVENAQASLRDAQARERAGVGTRFDVLQSQVNLANAQQGLTNSLAQQQIARRQFASFLNLAQSVDISAADAVQEAGRWEPTLEESIVEAFQNRPELQQVLAQRNISEQQRRQALSRLGPQVSLNGNYNILDQFDDGSSLTDGYSVGLRASLTLFDGGAAKANAAQSKANIAIAESQFASQRDQIRFNVEQFYAQLQSNSENIKTSTVALDQAREALRLARLRFEAGVGTQTDVIFAENDLTRSEGNRVTAILNYNRALANLQRTVTFRSVR
ncbi:TolC family protein [Nodularia spumigena]|uniref:TolC family protein n=1 Tax=Nodularia spumigena TaxID=70799 RepID=UPI00232F23E9|nr:TolC family protein [Nodularia spumigena]MDB9355866.1 TolC family protein [Nodularia spumigena CS-587/03]MDB9318279.1 TolC family protein [Nodularia spumigena CS-590/01A]MDB9323026.1 TolC family protein [Nodularia spumigena CS-591/07A]MDB9325372.1 TolC family protein [Nodularia spumigena CS-590/02]MDB9332940.1 TolC family protein [Nodularia spumigena CS-591/04]